MRHTAKDPRPGVEPEAVTASVHWTLQPSEHFSADQDCESANPCHRLCPNSGSAYFGGAFEGQLYHNTV